MTTQKSSRRPDDTVTVIGAGPMAMALSEVLLEQGHSLTVWNRTPHKLDRVETAGAYRARTITEALSASAVTIVCLADYEAMYQVIGSAGDSLAGRTLINLSSGTPNEARSAAGWAEVHDVTYLDGAIMVPPMFVGQSDAVFLYSGSPDPFDEQRRLLTSLGDPRHLGADPGLAVLYNVALLEMMYAIMNGWLHASALVGSAGVPAVKFADLAFDWFMPTVLSPQSFAEQAPELDNADYPGEFGTLRMNLNALDHLVRTSVEQGVHTDQPRLMKELAEKAVVDGRGDEGYLTLFELFKASDRH